jgi:hypothetical protein
VALGPFVAVAPGVDTAESGDASDGCEDGLAGLTQPARTTAISTTKIVWDG